MSELRVAFLVSGNGTTFEYLVEKMRRGIIPATPVVVISSSEKAFALERAKKLNVPSAVIREKDFREGNRYMQELLETLKKHDANFICLAGFLKMIPPAVIEAFADRMINIHPALLPCFGGKGMYGKHVHEAVIQSGARLSGATVHLVDAEYDHGRIISQQAVFVSPLDTAETLAGRVHAVELQLYASTLKHIAEGQIKISNGMVTYLGEQSA